MDEDYYRKILFGLLAIILLLFVILSYGILRRDLFRVSAIDTENDLTKCKGELNATMQAACMSTMCKYMPRKIKVIDYSIFDNVSAYTLFYGDYCCYPSGCPESKNNPENCTCEYVILCEVES